MASYQDLSEFERGVIVGAREMGHSIFEVAMKFGFSRATISRVYREYRESGKTSNLRHRCGQKNITFECWDINKCHHANHSTKHNRYGLSEPKAYSCTLVDCMTQSFTPRLGPSTPTWSVDD
ncbi:uncharacterized protein TNCV_1855231 [Trichonephila clavipes]|nr:uncharacterized protein TNCV_1855231 [Trichonephila clavipes]